MFILSGSLPTGVAPAIYRDIATRLKLSPKTVANHLSLARAKLEVDCDIALFRLAIAAGVTSVQVTSDK